MKKKRNFFNKKLVLCTLVALTLFSLPGCKERNENHRTDPVDTAIGSAPVSDTEPKEKTVDANDPYSYIGTWSSVTGNLEIWQDQNEQFHCYVGVGDVGRESSVWEYTCNLKNGQLGSRANGTKTNFVWEEDELTSQDCEYEDGTAIFKFNSDGTLSWLDTSEHYTDDMRFRRWLIPSPHDHNHDNDSEHINER